MFHVWEIYLDNRSWFHDARNEFQTGCTGIPDTLCGFFDIFIGPAFTAVWIFRKRDWQTQKQEPKEHFKCLLDRNNPACKHVFKSLSSVFRLHHAQWTQCSLALPQFQGQKVNRTVQSSPHLTPVTKMLLICITRTAIISLQRFSCYKPSHPATI